MTSGLSISGRVTKDSYFTKHTFDFVDITVGLENRRDERNDTKLYQQGRSVSNSNRQVPHERSKVPHHLLQNNVEFQNNRSWPPYDVSLRRTRRLSLSRAGGRLRETLSKLGNKHPLVLLRPVSPALLIFENKSPAEWERRRIDTERNKPPCGNTTEEGT